MFFVCWLSVPTLLPCTPHGCVIMHEHCLPVSDLVCAVLQTHMLSHFLFGVARRSAYMTQYPGNLSHVGRLFFFRNRSIINKSLYITQTNVNNAHFSSFVSEWRFSLLVTVCWFDSLVTEIFTANFLETIHLDMMVEISNSQYGDASTTQ